jgi:anti-sigma B factor antagonist
MEEAWDAHLVGEMVVDGNDIYMTVLGEIDAASVGALQRRLFEVIESTSGAVVLNMSGVSFIDSMGVRAVVAVHRRLSEQHRSLVLHEISAPVRRLLDLTGLGPTLGLEGRRREG